MSTRNFGEAVQSFMKAGIKPKWFLPIAPQGAQIGKNTFLEQKSLGKAPGRFDDRTNTWRGLGGGYVVKGIGKDDFEDMKAWPTPNVGILGRAYPGIDSDAMSDEAADLVEYCMSKAFGKDANCAVRIRGTGPRRLYALKCIDPNNEAAVVRTRHVSYKLAGSDTVHGLDIIGFGNQYVITGIHPSGDKYEWDPDASLQDFSTVDALTEIDNDDAERFLSILVEEIKSQGGEVIKSNGGRHGNEEIDTTGLKPVMSIEDALEGLSRIPNTPENYPFRDDLVSVLSAVRAALGRDADKAEPELREWATENPEWCDDDYFDKIWESLDRVRVGRDALDRFFRRNGVQSHVKNIFDNEAPRLSTEIEQRKADKKANRDDVLSQFAQNYIVGNISLRDANAQNVLRHVWDPYHDFPAWNWFKGELGESDWNILEPIHADERYPRNRIGYANFIRDLKRNYPEIFYSGETRDPRYGFGEIVTEEDDSGNVTRRVNMRHPSRAMMLARRKDPDVRRSQNDVETILTLGRGLFGKLFDYELDTQAYMAQRGDRPGSMLFMVGDSGVGKSLWMQLQSRLFDGNARGENSIDGTKLLNESSRRFVLARAQGFRILSIKELPENDKKASHGSMSAITSQLKQIVDPGPDGDWMQVEQKGKDIVTVRNFARVLVSSNYANSLAIEEQDRRIFYVEAGIKRDAKPDPEFYAEFVAILDDPERLAAWWRYLASRDIGGYDRNTAPPSSAAKDERIVMEMRNAGQRHLAAAMGWLKAEGRRVVRVDELADIMSEMSEAEYTNTNGEIDYRTKYAAKKDGKPDMAFMAALRQMRKADGIKLNHPGLRTNKARDPGTYIVGNRPDLYEEFLSADRNRLRDMIEDDIDRGLENPHPWPIFQLPED